MDASVLLRRSECGVNLTVIGIRRRCYCGKAGWRWLFRKCVQYETGHLARGLVLGQTRFNCRVQGVMHQAKIGLPETKASKADKQGCPGFTATKGRCEVCTSSNQPDVAPRGLSSNWVKMVRKDERNNIGFWNLHKIAFHRILTRSWCGGWASRLCCEKPQIAASLCGSSFRQSQRHFM